AVSPRSAVGGGVTGRGAAVGEVVGRGVVAVAGGRGTLWFAVGRTALTAACCTILGRSAATGGCVAAVPAVRARGVGLTSGCGVTCALASCCGLTFTMFRSTGSELRNALPGTAVA